MDTAQKPGPLHPSLRVLILKPSSLGDVIQALPVLRLLRKHRPESKIFWWIESTLSGLLAILGLHLYILGPTGSINLPFASPLVGFGQLWILPAWASYLLGLLPGAVMIWVGLSVMRQRRAAGLSAQPQAISLAPRACGAESVPRKNLWLPPVAAATSA